MASREARGGSRPRNDDKGNSKRPRNMDHRKNRGQQQSRTGRNDEGQRKPSQNQSYQPKAEQQQNRDSRHRNQHNSPLPHKTSQEDEVLRTYNSYQDVVKAARISDNKHLPSEDHPYETNRDVLFTKVLQKSKQGLQFQSSRQGGSSSSSSSTLTPSMKVGFSAEQEMQRRHECASWIVQIGLYLYKDRFRLDPNQNRSRRYTAVALIYMHRYFNEIPYSEFSITNITTACLYLASKVEEHSIPLRFIIMQVYKRATAGLTLDVQFVNPKDNLPIHQMAHANLNNVQGSDKPKFTQLFNDAIAHELVLLQVLAFTPEVSDPFLFLNALYYEQAGNEKSPTAGSVAKNKSTLPTHVFEAATFMTTNFLMLTPLCTYYTPTTIAVAMINIAAQWSCSAPLKLPFPTKKIVQVPGSEPVIKSYNYWWQAQGTPALNEVKKSQVIEVCELFYDCMVHSAAKCNIWAKNSDRLRPNNNKASERLAPSRQSNDSGKPANHMKQGRQSLPAAFKKTGEKPVNGLDFGEISDSSMGSKSSSSSRPPFPRPDPSQPISKTHQNDSERHPQKHRHSKDHRADNGGGRKHQHGSREGSKDRRESKKRKH